jgi:nucleotide-binding universal stress UspA family protein
MEYTTLLVHLDAARDNAALLRIAGDLASRLDARVIGIAGAQPTLAVYNSAYVASDLIAQERDEMDSCLARAEAAFNAAFPEPARNLGWRAATSFAGLHEFIAAESRAADLIVTEAPRGGLLQGWTRHANIGALAVRAGRPVFVVPDGCAGLSLDRAVIGWQDMRETRRAIADALPLLRLATQATVVEIGADPDAARRMEDVVLWLGRHGVKADSKAVSPSGTNAARLRATATQLGAGLLVAGAYGHSRPQEWAFGGVTHDLLLCSDICTLLSH